MSQTFWEIAIAAITLILVPFIAWLFNRGVIRNLDGNSDSVSTLNLSVQDLSSRMEQNSRQTIDLKNVIDRRLSSLEGMFGELKDEVLRDYATKKEMAEDRMAHAAFQSRLGCMQDTITELKTTLKLVMDGKIKDA